MALPQYDDIVRTSLILIDSDSSGESCIKLGDKDGESTQSLSINVPLESSGIGLGNQLKYDFHKIFTNDESIDGYFNEECKPIVYDIINNGKNGCISHYRNNFNFDSTIIRSNGLVHSCLEDIMKNNNDLLFFCSYIEINGDQLRDLGKLSLQHIQISNDITESLPLYSDKFPSVFHNNANFLPFHEQNDDITDDSCRIGTNKDDTFYIQNLVLYPINNVSDAISIIENGDSWIANDNNNFDDGKESKESYNSNNGNRLFQIYMFHPQWDTVRSLTFVDLFDGENNRNSSSYNSELREESKLQSKEDDVINNSMNNSNNNTYPTKFDLESIRRYMITKGPVNSCILAALHETLKGGCNFSISTSISCNSLSYYNSFCALNFIDSYMHYGANGQKFGESRDHGGMGSNEQIEKMKNNMKGANPAVNRFISSLRLFGITASLTNDQQITINGKAVDVETVVGTRDSKDIVSAGSSVTTTATKKGEPSVKKLQKMVSDLEDELRDAKTKAKDRKDEITEKAKQIQSLTLQLTRSQTSLRHKEFQYDNLQDDKARLLEEQDHTLTSHHNQHIQTIITDNQNILAQQHKVLQSVPENLRVFTATRNNFNKQFKDTNAAAKIERDLQMKKLSDASRAEVRTLKLQYEHWLAIKNDQIKTFADQFNHFRTEKSNQLQACEMEVVRLYEHATKLEKILTGIEQGEYSVTQKQGLNGRPTTGVLIPVDEYYDVSSRRDRKKTFKFDGNGSYRDDMGSPKATNMANTWGAKIDDFTINIGGVMLPKGLRPTNPFVQPKENISLAVKIVRKYKSLEAAATVVQEEEFQKTLEKAASGTALGVVDPKIQERISQMISTSSMSREGQAFVKTSPKKRSQKDTDTTQSKIDTFGNVDNSIESKMNNDEDEMKFSYPLPLRNDTSTPSTNDFSSLLNGVDKESSEEMKLEISRLRNNLTALENELENQRLKTDKIVRGISSDETINYILKLETEHRDLHKKLKVISSQLHAAKVSNAALQRTLKK